MRMRTLLAAAAVSAVAAGTIVVPANSVTAPPAANAGSLITWGKKDGPDGTAPLTKPADLTSPVRSVAASPRSTGVVTIDGKVRVWGKEDAPEVTGVPVGIADATAITLNPVNAAVLHADGRVSAWGASTAFSQVPADLRAKAIAIWGENTGLAVRPDGTLATWGDEPSPEIPVPSGLSGLVDVAASPTHAVALRADGSIVMWGPALPGLIDVPDFGGKKVVKIAAASLYSGAVLEDGTMEIWGFLPPEGEEPEFDGQTPAETVVSLGLGTNAAAVTADGAVHAWGPTAEVAEVPESLAGKPVSGVAMGDIHGAAVITAFRDLTKPSITGLARVGQTLTATPATFSLAPSAPPAGQWFAGSQPIAGKTATTLVLDASLSGLPISYRTTAVRNGETVVSSSAPVGPLPKASAKVKAKAKAKGKTKKLVKRVTVTVTVTSAKGVSPAGKVTITLKGKTKKKVTVKVNAKGKATGTFKKVKRGKYTATVKYAGNAQVKAATGKVKFKA